jgi:hypothetical protein
MKDVLSIVIVLVALACGFGGYTLGRVTAPQPWRDERKKLYAERLKVVKAVREMREVARYEVNRDRGKPSQPSKRRTKAPTSTQAAKKG